MSTPIKQRDLTDCGAACLRFIGAHYRRDVPVARLRQLAGTNQRGSTALVLLDLSLPDADGLALATELAQLPRPLRVLLCTARHDSAVLFAASEPHIAGLLWKAGDLREQLPLALITIACGGRYYPPDVREALRRFRADPAAFFKILSLREIALLPHFARAEADDEIAFAHGLSAHTVKSHRQNIMRKLDLRGTARLTHWAIVNGFSASQLPAFGLTSA